jgi:two-component system nitrogen regulation response regulator GlnG
MKPPRSAFDGRFVVVADEDRAIAGFVIETLLDDGHAVFQAYDGLSAVELALGLKVCDLVISNTRVGGVAGLELIHELRAQLPKLPILYLANHGRSWSGLERQLPDDVPILREPFTAEQLRAVVRSLLTADRESPPGPQRLHRPHTADSPGSGPPPPGERRRRGQ